MYSQFQAYSNEMFTNDEISGQKRAEKKKGAYNNKMFTNDEIRRRREPNKGGA